MSNEHARTGSRSNRANSGARDKAAKGGIFGAQALPKAMDQGVSTFSKSSGLPKKSCQPKERLDWLRAGGKNSGQAFDISNSRMTTDNK
jgi:hypothetical protein